MSEQTNSLRRLVDGWRKDRDNETAEKYKKWDEGFNDALTICASALSAELPKVERLVKAVENSLRARGGGKKDCGHDFECVCPDDELRAALQEIQS